MPKKYVRQCKVELHYKNGTKGKVIMDLDLNDSVDDQICNRFNEDKLRNWWWHEVNGPSETELKKMFFESNV